MSFYQLSVCLSVLLEALRRKFGDRTHDRREKDGGKNDRSVEDAREQEMYAPGDAGHNEGHGE